MRGTLIDTKFNNLMIASFGELDIIFKVSADITRDVRSPTFTGNVSDL